MEIGVIGGQGMVVGGGKQRLSPAVMRAIGGENIWWGAAKQKRQQCDGRPWGLDTGDESLDSALAGIIPVITGYQDKVYYPILYPIYQRLRYAGTS